MGKTSQRSSTKSSKISVESQKTPKRKKTKFDRIHFSSKTYKHRTPIGLFKDLDQEFYFNFDPARPAIVGDYNENALVKVWIIKKKPKKKLRIFLNPPYDRKLMERFIKKTCVLFVQGRVEVAVFLLPFRATAVRYLVRQFHKKVEFRLLDDRVHFSGAELGAPFDSVIAVLRDSNKEKDVVG